MCFFVPQPFLFGVFFARDCVPSLKLGLSFCLFLLLSPPANRFAVFFVCVCFDPRVALCSSQFLSSRHVVTTFQHKCYFHHPR